MAPQMSENRARSLRGELYHAFTQEMTLARRRARAACKRYNSAVDPSRRERVRLWKELVGDETPLPERKPGCSEEEDEAALEAYPWVESPVRADYGTNVELGEGTFVNYNAVFLDTCKIKIGARTLVAAGVSFFAANHPLDPDLRNGTQGPEFGAPVVVGEDCFIGGNATILPGVTIGKGSTVGAASVVTKDVPEYSVVAGNPARVIRQVARNTMSDEEKQRILDIAKQSA